MRYDYEFKKMCVDLYRQGKWPETPGGYNDPGKLHPPLQASTDAAFHALGPGSHLPFRHEPIDES